MTEKTAKLIYLSDTTTDLLRTTAAKLQVSGNRYVSEAVEARLNADAGRVAVLDENPNVSDEILRLARSAQDLINLAGRIDGKASK